MSDVARPPGATPAQCSLTALVKGERHRCVRDAAHDGPHILAPHPRDAEAPRGVEALVTSAATPFEVWGRAEPWP